MAIRTIKATPTVIQTTQIRIVGYDSWSGPKVLQRLEADTKEEAEKYCREYNTKSCPPLKRGECVPEYYVKAEIV